MHRLSKLTLLTLANLFALQLFAQSIVVRGSLNTQTNQAVFARGNVAYLVGTNSLVCVNITNPASPTVQGQSSPNVGTLSTIDVSGDNAFCASPTVGITIFRIADPTAPSWVRNFAMPFPVRDIDAQDTLLAVATGGNISLVGVRAVSNPHILATYGRAGSTIEFDLTRQKIMVGSATGAFSLNVNLNIAGGDTTFTLTLADEYGSGQGATPCTYTFPYFTVARTTHVYALFSDELTLAGAYDSPALVEAITSVDDAIFIGLATSVVQYLDHSQDVPVFQSSVGVPAQPNGIAAVPGRNLVCVAQNAGISVLEYGNLAVEEPENPVVPKDINLTAYPNPFNSKVDLIVDADKSGLYELKIFDLLGREIKSDQLFVSGRATLSLDFRGFSSGEYLAQIKNEQNIATARLIYLP